MRDRGHISKGGRTLSQDHEVQREILPLPDRPYTGLITHDAKDPDASFPPIDPLRPPEGAPNVLVVLLDDVGFGATRCRSGRPARWARSTLGRPAAAGSSTSTASSVGRPTNTRRRSTRTRCPWSQTGRPRKATTSPRT